MKQSRIARQDYSEYLKSAKGREKFGIIFLDPPYAKDMPGEILKKVSRADILSDDGIVVCESDKDNMNEDIYDLEFVKKYKYGSTYVVIFRKKEGERVED